MERTPGKWEVTEGEEGDFAIMAWDNDEGIAFDVADSLWEKDAAYIVRAVNCHDRLVEMAKEYADLLESMAINHGDMVQCRKLIAEVEGGGNE